jgi:hypothetical protein
MARESYRSDIHTLHSIFIEETRKFLSALENGEPAHILENSRRRLRSLDQMIQLLRGPAEMPAPNAHPSRASQEKPSRQVM